MKIQNLLRRCLSFILLLSVLLGMVPIGVLGAEAQESAPAPVGEDTTLTDTVSTRGADTTEDESLVPTWPNIASHYQVYVNPYSSYEKKSYTYMSSLTVLNGFAYFIRTMENRSAGVLARINLTNRTPERVTIDGDFVTTRFYQAKSLDTANVNARDYLFVATGKTDADSILLMEVNGKTATIKAGFTVQLDGTGWGVDRLTVLSTNGTKVTLLIRTAWKFYTVVVDVTSSGGTLAASPAFELNSSATTALAKTVAGIPDSYPGNITESSEIGKVNLLGMDYYEDKLYIATVVDCCSVVLVYTNMSELIDSGTTAETTADKCIRSSGAGYEAYFIEDLSVDKGVVFFNSRSRWITSTSHRGDICHFTNSTTPRYDFIESFREIGNYMICGVQDNQKMVMFNHKTSDGRLNIVDKTTVSEKDLRNAYFALESDRQGYWYIRSLARGYNLGSTESNELISPYYITLTADGSVVLAPKEEGNDRQLWYLRYDEMSGDNKLYAIHNKATGLYLNNETTNGVHTVVATPGGKNFVLQLQKVCSDPDKSLEDLLFDYEFYKAAYPEAANMTEEEAKTHFKETGKAKGYQPGPLFDPQYYLDHNADVKSNATYGSLAGAYDHYILYGFWEVRQASPFFSLAEYYSRGNNQDIRDLYSSDKVLYLYHYINYGIKNNATKDHRAGSNKFDLKEFSEEFKLTFNAADSYAVLRDYALDMLRLEACDTREELEAILFDPEVYSKDPALSESKVANLAGNTYEEKLWTHWVNYGRTEGRTASMFFSAPYYASRYPDEVENLADAYEYFVTTGFWKGHIGSEYVAMSQDPENLCMHQQTAIAQLSSCTDVCKKITFCASCKFVVHKETSPALAHTDTDKNTLCDRCNHTITADLLSQNALLQLPPPAPDNVLVTDVSGFVKDSKTKPEGTYYMVQKNLDGVYRILNPLVQSNVGTIAATQVYEIDSSILGVDPDMAVKITYSPDQTPDTNHYYFNIEQDYYLSYRGGSDSRISDQLIRSKSGTNIAPEPNQNAHTIALARKIDGNTHYLCLEQRLGMEFFEWSFSKGEREPDDVFYLYRLREDLLHTEALYAALQKAVAYIPYGSAYDSSAHDHFLSLVAQAKSLYEQYNGRSLTGVDLLDKDELQTLLDEKERELLNCISTLIINAEGKEVKYFSANLFRWNEDNINALVAQIKDSQAKGFFFENANNKPDTAPSFSVYDDKTSETINGVSTYAQMYSIYSGLAAPDLSTAVNPPFHNDTVVATDYWSIDEIEGAKEVFTDIRVPFLFGEDGYYSLNSDTHGIFFPGEPASGSTLSILDRPMAYYWSSGPKYGVGTPGYYATNSYSYRPANGYVTAFQPFAAPTSTVGNAYGSAASVFSAADTVEAYIMDGVALASGKSPSMEISGRGTPTWGFGMQLNIGLRMTADGCINNDPNQPITFSFSGDDDVWVYLDGKLVMDMGGSHDAVQGSINFATGDVTISSEKYGQIRDKNPNGYGRGDNALQYGEQITDQGSILTNHMVQRNIYTDVFSMDVKEFADSSDTHILTIYYMDRGKGRTNCAIRFNMPQSDALIVETDVHSNYANPDGTLRDKAIPPETIAFLGTLDFGYTLMEGNSPVVGETYFVYDTAGNLVKTGVTDASGHFTMRNTQRAEFPHLQFLGQSYHVIGDPLSDHWVTPKWTGSNNGTALTEVTSYTSPTATANGHRDTMETLIYYCTNFYTYDPDISAEEQVVVLDYGKPIDIQVVRNAVVNGISEVIVREAVITDVESSDRTYGQVTISADRKSLRFTPTRMLDKELLLTCTLEMRLQLGSVSSTPLVVRVIPGTMVYYETDFADGVFRLKDVTAASTANTWPTTGTSQNNTQDDGNVGNQLYDFAIHKESIPSNAFFADFDGDNGRYFTDAIYNGMDFCQESNWAYNHKRCDPPQIDPVAGTLTLSMFSTEEEGRPYVQTGTNLTTNFKLNFHPEENFYVQARIKLKNFTFLENPCFVLNYYIGVDKHEGLGESAGDEYYEAGRKTLPKTASNGEYFTVTFKLKEPKHTKITALRFYISGVQHTDTANPGIMTADYFYVGPLTDKSGDLGQSLNIAPEKVNELYFGFDNSKQAQDRYTQPQYRKNGGVMNYDRTSNPLWGISTSSSSKATVDTAAGLLNIEVSDAKGSDGLFGPYFSPTTTSGQITSLNNRQYDPLQFVPTPGEKTWLYLRFKYTNCVQDGNTTILFRPLGTNPDGTSVNGILTAPFTFTGNNQYITIKLDVTEAVNTVVSQCGALHSFYLRLRNVKGNGSIGTLSVDYIYLGPEKEAFRRNVFIDFNNSYNSDYRYAAPLYTGINMDDPAFWSSTYFDTSTENGILHAVPTEKLNNQNEGQLYPPESNLNYTLNGENDIIRVRARFTGVHAKAGTAVFQVYFGPSSGWWHGSAAGAELVPMNIPIDLEKDNGNWRDFEFDIAFLKQYFTEIRIIVLAVGYCQFEDGGKVEFDYVYIGAEDEFEETADFRNEPVLMHFDNAELDQARYTGTLYGGKNYDLAESWISINEGSPYFTAEMVDGTMKLTPGDGQKEHATGYGSIYPNPWDQSTLNYRMTGNDFLQMRFKFEGATLHPNTKHGVPRAKFCFGDEFVPYTEELPDGTAQLAERIEWDLDLNAVQKGEWITVTGDLSTFPWRHGRPDVIRFLIPIFQDIQFSDEGHVLIDYIYLGPTVEGRPVSDSLFFGFDNMESDKDRYASPCYYSPKPADPNRTFPNYDDPSDIQWNGSTYTRKPNSSVNEFVITGGDIIMPIYPHTGDNWYAMYIGKAYNARYRQIQFTPGMDHYCQVRFRLENLISSNSENTARVILNYYVDGSDAYYDTRQTFSMSANPQGGYYTVTFPLNEADYYTAGKITGLYLGFRNMKSADGVNPGRVYIDYFFVGAGIPNPEHVYGYDSSYTDDSLLSNGSSFVVEGKGVKLNESTKEYTEASFDFTGTGFDIISRTGPQQATIRVEVLDKKTSKVVKQLTVNNKGELELYQIPVVSVQGLPFGEYSVKLWVNTAVTTAYPFLNRGGTFHFDAVRIYDPMNSLAAGNATALDAYIRDKEAYPHIKEVRNILLSSNSFASLTTTIPGAVFLDVNSSMVNPNNPEDMEDASQDYTTVKVQDYNKLGPKNEVYLAPDQAVAFKLRISSVYAPVSVDVGVKTIVEKQPGKLVAAIVKKADTTGTVDPMTIASRREIDVGSATAQYYSLNISADSFFEEEDGLWYCYIVLYNAPTGIEINKNSNVLSVTDLKLAYDAKPEAGLPKDQYEEEETIPTEPTPTEAPTSLTGDSSPAAEGTPEKRNTESLFDFMVDGDTTSAAELVIRRALETPVLAEGTKIMHSLNLASDIAINYVVKKADLDSYNSFYLDCLVPTTEGEQRCIRIAPVERDGYYYFTLEGLTAVQMKDVIEATLYMEKNGRQYYSETDFYSIAQYAYTQLSKTGISEELQALCAELLRYGSAAQVFKGYGMETLADSDMTHGQRALLTDLAAVSFSSHNRELDDMDAPTILWKGKSLILDSKVTLRYIIDTTGYEGSVEDLTLRITYRDHSGTDKTVTLTNGQPYGSLEGCYSFDFSGLLAAELRTVLHATVYAGETQLSTTLEYSVDTYGNNKTGTLETLCRALMAYSDSAKAYFATT